jgi:hypothetical protein
MEQKKGRMSRVYTGDKKPASPEQVKKGGKMPERGERTSKHNAKTPRMGG